MTGTQKGEEVNDMNSILALQGASPDAATRQSWSTVSLNCNISWSTVSNTCK